MKAVKTILKILAGIILIAVGVLVYLPKGLVPVICRGWYIHLWAIIKGSIGLILAFVGVIFLAISKE